MQPEDWADVFIKGQHRTRKLLQEGKSLEDAIQIANEEIYRSPDDYKLGKVAFAGISILRKEIASQFGDEIKSILRERLLASSEVSPDVVAAIVADVANKVSSDGSFKSFADKQQQSFIECQNMWEREGIKGFSKCSGPLKTQLDDASTEDCQTLCPSKDVTSEVLFSANDEETKDGEDSFFSVEFLDSLPEFSELNYLAEKLSRPQSQVQALQSLLKWDAQDILEREQWRDIAEQLFTIFSGPHAELHDAALYHIVDFYNNGGGIHRAQLLIGLAISLKDKYRKEQAPAFAFAPKEKLPPTSDALFLRDLSILHGFIESLMFNFDYLPLNGLGAVVDVIIGLLIRPVDPNTFALDWDFYVGLATIDPVAQWLRKYLGHGVARKLLVQRIVAAGLTDILSTTIASAFELNQCTGMERENLIVAVSHSISMLGALQSASLDLNLDPASHRVITTLLCESSLLEICGRSEKRLVEVVCQSFLQYYISLVEQHQPLNAGAFISRDLSWHLNMLTKPIEEYLRFLEGEMEGKSADPNKAILCLNVCSLLVLSSSSSNRNQEGEDSVEKAFLQAKLQLLRLSCRIAVANYGQDLEHEKLGTLPAAWRLLRSCLSPPFLVSQSNLLASDAFSLILPLLLGAQDKTTCQYHQMHMIAARVLIFWHPALPLLIGSDIRQEGVIEGIGAAITEYCTVAQQRDLRCSGLPAFDIDSILARTYAIDHFSIPTIMRVLDNCLTISRLAKHLVAKEHLLHKSVLQLLEYIYISRQEVKHPKCKTFADEHREYLEEPWDLLDTWDLGDIASHFDLSSSASLQLAWLTLLHIILSPHYPALCVAFGKARAPPQTKNLSKYFLPLESYQSFTLDLADVENLLNPQRPAKDLEVCVMDYIEEIHALDISSLGSFSAQPCEEAAEKICGIDEHFLSVQRTAELAATIGCKALKAKEEGRKEADQALLRFLTSKSVDDTSDRGTVSFVLRQAIEMKLAHNTIADPVLSEGISSVDTSLLKSSLLQSIAKYFEEIKSESDVSSENFTRQVGAFLTFIPIHNGTVQRPKERDEAIAKRTNLDWFALSIYMIVEDYAWSHSTLQELSSQTFNYVQINWHLFYLWPALSDAWHTFSGSREDEPESHPLMQTAALVDTVLLEEFPEIWTALYNATIPLSSVIYRWLRQCFWNYLDWPYIKSYIAICLIKGADYQVYFTVATFAILKKHIIFLSTKSSSHLLRFLVAGFEHNWDGHLDEALPSQEQLPLPPLSEFLALTESIASDYAQLCRNRLQEHIQKSFGAASTPHSTEGKVE